MTTAHHDPHAHGFDVTAAEVNRPLGQLDSAIGTVIATGSGTATTLTAQANSGQASLTVASSAGFAPGDPIYIGTGAEPANSRIVATVPGGGVTITVTVNLTNTYAIGKPVSKSPVEIVAARGGFTTLGGRIGLIESRVFDVRKYGAVGDGTTDDHDAIQAALDAAHEADAGMVFFPTGVYYVGTQLTVYGSTHLEGVGRSGNQFEPNPNNGMQGSVLLSGEGQTIIITEGADGGVGDPPRPDHYSFRGLGFRNGSVAETNALQTLVKIKYANNVIFDDCIFNGRGLGGCRGLNLYNTGEVVVKSCIFYQFPQHTATGYTLPAVEIAPTPSIFPGGFPQQSIAFSDCMFGYNGRAVDVFNAIDPSTDGLQTVSFDNVFFKKDGAVPFDTDVSRGITCYNNVRNLTIGNAKFEDIRYPLTVIGDHVRIANVFIDHAETGIEVSNSADVVIDGLTLSSWTTNPITTGVHFAANNRGPVTLLDYDVIGDYACTALVNDATLLGCPVGIFPVYGAGIASLAVIGAANRCVYVPVEVRQAVIVAAIKYVVGVSSGNVSAGLFNSAGTRLAATGIVACPATGTGYTNFIASVVISPGTYYLALSCDNNTATFGVAITGAASLGGARYQATAHPVPTTATFTGTTNLSLSLMGSVNGSYV